MLKEVYELTRHPGWRHVRELFSDRIAGFRDISTLAQVPAEELKSSIALNLAVSATLESIISTVENTAEQHKVQDVEPVRVYKGDEF